MATTTVKRLSYSTGDNSLPLFCDDPAAQAKGTTDFCFDWRAPIQWGGTIPAAGADQGQPTFQNLALDNAPLIGRNQAVTAVPNGPLGAGDGRGVKINSNSLRIEKAGTALGEVGNPTAEGFRDFQFDVWCLLNAEVGSDFASGLFGAAAGANVAYGMRVHNGAVVEFGSFRNVRPAVVGELMHVAMHLAFDTANDTSTLRIMADGAEVGTASAYIAPSAMPAPEALLLGQLGGYGVGPVTIVRATRTFTAWPGEDPLDPLKLHQDEERFRSRLI